MMTPISRWITGTLCVVVYTWAPTSASPASICEGGERGYVVGMVSKDRERVRFWVADKPGDDSFGQENLVCALQPGVMVEVVGPVKEL